jgi:heat shock protein 4
VEEELAQAAAEADKDRDAEDEDDHDTRKLKKGERLKLAVMNKTEGNELLTGGNVEHATRRYIKALQHVDKLFDLTEQEKQEVWWNLEFFGIYCYM